MYDVLRWWLASSAIGLLALPLCRRVFQRLPDGGYAFCRMLGLLLLIYALWLGGLSGMLPFSAGSALLALGALAIVAIPLAARDRLAFIAWARRSHAYIISTEAVFLGVLLTIALLRSYSPAIRDTEKPFEFANYNAVNRAANFAPQDPWYAGKPVAYYYLGYAGMVAIAKLAGTPPATGFNIALALTGALAAVSMFGLAANCAALLRDRSRLSSRWPLIAGAAAVLLLLVFGNLESVFELGAVHGWNPNWVYSHFDVAGLKPAASIHWYPDGGFFAAPWRATRFASNWNIFEFPAFSLLLGDLHPHVLALPYKLLVAGFAVSLLLAGGLPKPGAWSSGLLTCLPAALALGALIAVHPWEYPIFAVLLVFAIVARSLLAAERDWQTAIATAGALIAVSLLLFAPYFVNAGGEIAGIVPVDVFYRAPDVEAEAMYLPFIQLLLFWTPLLMPTIFFLLRSQCRCGWRPLRRQGSNVASLVVLLPLIWAIAVVLRHGGAGLGNELQARGVGGWLTVLTLGGLLVLAGSSVVDQLAPPQRRADIVGSDGEANAVASQTEPTVVDERTLLHLLLLAGATLALLLLLGAELFRIADGYETRSNTVFKLWYAAWALLSLVGSVGGICAFVEWREWRASSGSARLLRPLALAAAGLVAAGALVFPVMGAVVRSDGFAGTRTLNGLAFLKSVNPDELNAAAWLNGHVPDATPVLEAVGQSYDEPTGGRISARTGLPTIIDWPFHEIQHRGANTPTMQRVEDVRQIYESTDSALAFQLLKRYSIQYIVVGGPERAQYGAVSAAGLQKFAGMGSVVFQSPGVTIYRVGPAPLFAAAS